MHTPSDSLLNKIRTRLKRLFSGQAIDPLETTEFVARYAQETVDVYAQPVRKTIIKRFPVLFSLLVTFGVAATLLGLEQIILQYDILQNSPWLIFLIGVSVLVFTGTLYKKLG